MFKDKIEGSIDVGSGMIKGISIKKGEIENISSERLPMGAVVSGNIEDSLSIVDKLKTIVERLSLKNKKVVVSLPIQNFVIKFLEIPEMEEEAKLPFIEGELDEIVPNFSGEDFITNYYSLEFKNNNEKVMVVTIKKEKINDIIEILTSVKLKPIKIIPDFLSLFNLEQIQKHKIIEDTKGASIMTIDIGAEATKIFIENDGIIKMQRLIAIGGNDFSDIVQREKSVDYDEAEQYKKELEVFEDEEVNDEFYVQDDIEKEISNLVEELGEQIERTIEFYKMQEGLLGVDGIIISGGGTLLKGLKLVIEKKIVQEFNEMKTEQYFMKIKDKIAGEDIAIYDIALGNIVEEVI
ncbi:pilus assembly protein PilM [Haliovirga abyssi]|uniref:Type IV pilus assembly protein PilM n=1 Tax=Haliovirga abyssi TaxID=2996794 RepID=A0AAU9D7N2_9FUSO|nr:pilus assembly protein PilM [Haliovirga abyssi]BDU49581.1 hypothetical protein HLVA_01500 [Haliovirga abyssi]